MGVAPDGSPVALYLALPGESDARWIHAAIADGADILELGCGVGRVTRPLAQLGHAVTAVDKSTEMLAAFPATPGTETVLADIESLNLGRRFGVVLLQSHMINGELGAAFLGTAARHVTNEGVVLVQRHEPGWIDSAAPMKSERGGVAFELTDVAHPQPGVLVATAVYTVSATVYRQPFIAFETDDLRLDEMARRVGLRLDGYVDDDPSWVRLVPVGNDT